MGKEFFSNAEEDYFLQTGKPRVTSTVSSEWILKWNFNANFIGVGFHEICLPGYPASHSCLIEEEEDARFFFMIGPIIGS
jgi:hypothetical protein